MKLESATLLNEITSIFIENGLLIESSLSDLNKVLNSKDNVAIFFAGSPRTGKSTIVNKFIKPKVRNLVVVDVDDISQKFSHDPNVYHKGAANVAKHKFANIVGGERKDRVVIVYDVTGGSYTKYRTVITNSKKNGYKVVFIHAFSPLETTIKRNEKASRKVDLEYLKQSWKVSQERVKKFWSLFEPDLYLVAYNSDDMTAWYRYNGSKITK